MANPFIAMVFGYLKEQGIDTKDMSVQEAIDKYQEMNKGENGLSNKSEDGKITKEDYHKIRSLVNDKISTYRTQLDRKGKITTTIFTFEHIYIVEINNDDDYSFEILDKELNDWWKNGNKILKTIC